MFGGGFFGKPIPMRGQQGAAVPLGAQGQAQKPQGQLGVVPQGQAVQVGAARPAAAAPVAPVGFPQQPLMPPTRVPMGDKKDCPICRG